MDEHEILEYAMVCDHVTKHYKSFTLDNISFALPKGCIMGFIGENGAGKTTTIKLMLDLIRADSGKLYMLGCDSTQMDENVREHLGVVLDESHFPGELTVQNIRTVMKRFYKTWDDQRFAKFIKKYHVPTDRRIKEFSRGMRMKLTMGVALCHDTKLLVLDEATSGMDPVVRDEMLDLLLDFIQDEEHSVFISSHILSDLEKICDYIAFIHGGRLIFCDNKDILLEQYGIWRGTREAMEQLDESAIAGVRRYAFGVEALVFKEKLPAGYETDSAGLEDIMVFFNKKEGEQE